MNNYDFEYPILYILSSVELLLHLIELPISGVNLFLVGRTSLIHPNMKFILLYQSAWIFLRGLARLAICALKFIVLHPVAPELWQPMKFVYQLSAYNRNFLPHVLIIERIMATVMAKNYEHKRGWHFSAIWSPIVFLISLYDALSTSSANTSIYGLITTFSLLILGIFEFLLFVWIWQYNEKMYRRSLKKEKHSLTEKYQLSENIRIGKQLTPTLLFQLINVLITSIYLTTSNFHLQFYPNIMIMVTVTLSTLFGLLIEITMITCHPFLKRDFNLLLKGISAASLCCHGSRVNTEHAGGGIAMRGIIDGTILTHSPIKDHFDLLKESWDQELIRSKKT